MTQEIFKRKRPEEPEPTVPQTEPTPAARPEARALLERLQAEAAQLRQRVPGFDLAQALTEPRFLRLVQAGLSVPEAWSALKQPALLRQAFEAGVKQGRAQAAQERNQARPMENGGAPAGVVTGLDPAHLSRDQRREIHTRVRRGEQVRF